MSNHYTQEFQELHFEDFETDCLSWRFRETALFTFDHRAPIKYYSSMSISVKRHAKPSRSFCKHVWEKHRTPALRTEYILIPPCVGCKKQMYISGKFEGDVRIQTFTNWHQCIEHHNGLRNNFGEVQGNN